MLGGFLAWDRFRNEVGESHRVPQGGVRLYWPHFGAENDHLRHPFWSRRRISEESGDLARILASLLARISVHAVPLDPLPRELQRQAAEAQRREAAARQDLDELVQLLDQENADLRRETDDQQSELAQLREQVAALQRDLDAQRASWATVSGFVGPGSGDDENAVTAADDDASALSPDTWSEFAEALEAVQSNAFVMTDHAREMCDASPYPDPARMWWHLERLAEAAEAWAAADCSVGKRLDEWIHENYGIEVALHDSDLGDAAQFDYEGASYSREPHVKVDDYVDPASCGRIYFAYDSTNKRFIVDHVGLHL